MVGTFVNAHGPHSRRRIDVGWIDWSGTEDSLNFEVNDYDERVWPPKPKEGFCVCGNDLWMMSCGCPEANDIY